MAYKSENHDDLTCFKNRLWKLMSQKNIYTARELAKKLHEGKLVVVNHRPDTEYAYDYSKDIAAIESILKKIQTHLKSDDTDKLQGEYVKAYCTFFQCSADYLFGNIECTTHDIEFISKETNLSCDAVLYIQNATEYEQLILDTILKKEYFWDICYAIYSYMQTYYKEFQIQDANTGNVKLQDKEKMEFAEYRATKHFSNTLINKISKDEDIKKYNKYEHDMEILRHVILSDDFTKGAKQAFDEFEKFRKDGKGGFNDFIKYLEKKRNSDETT